MTTAIVFSFVRVAENICTICLKNFHSEYGKCVATVPVFAETLTKRFLMFWVRNGSFLRNYCLSLEFLSFKTVKMAKGLLSKNALGK